MQAGVSAGVGAGAAVCAELLAADTEECALDARRHKRNELMRRKISAGSMRSRRYRASSDCGPAPLPASAPLARTGGFSAAIPPLHMHLQQQQQQRLHQQAVSEADLASGFGAMDLSLDCSPDTIAAGQQRPHHGGSFDTPGWKAAMMASSAGGGELRRSRFSIGSDSSLGGSFDSTKTSPVLTAARMPHTQGSAQSLASAPAVASTGTAATAAMAMRVRQSAPHMPPPPTPPSPPAIPVPSRAGPSPDLGPLMPPATAAMPSTALPRAQARQFQLPLQMPVPNLEPSPAVAPPVQVQNAGPHARRD